MATNENFDFGRYVSDLGGKAMGFLDSPQAPVALGELAQAIMGGSPQGVGSWQSGVGRVASALGKSKIASNEASRQAAEKKAWNEAIMGLITGKTDVPLTADGIPGATNVSRTIGPDGKVAVKLTGDLPTAPGDYAGDNYVGNAPKKAAPGGMESGVRNLLPFYLALLGKGGAEGVNLTGLDPAQINEITQQRNRADVVRNQTVGQIYQAINQQALADYYDRMPKEERNKVKGEIPGKNGNWHLYMEDGRVIDTKVPAPDRYLNFGGGHGTLKSFPITIPKEGGGTQTVEVIFDTDKKVPIAVEGIPGIQAGVPTVSPKKEKEATKIDPELVEKEAYLLKYPRNDESDAVGEYVNKHLPDEALYFYFKVPHWYGDSWTRMSLPMLKSGKQLTFGDVRRQAEKDGITVDEALKIVFDKIGAK